MTQAIEIRIWNTQVGAVALDPALGCYAFEYNKKWKRYGIELAPRMMPTNSAKQVFTFPSLGESFKGLPGLLSDALPDAFGNALIDAWMATHGTNKPAITTLDRLAYMGKRGLGALEFRPVKFPAKESKQPLEMKSLVECARRVLEGELSSDTHAKAALANMIKVGTSAGGARAKAVVAWNPLTNEIRSGQFDVADGFEHWLLKFDGVGKDSELGTTADYGRIEYAYHLMAVDAGIVMSPCRLLKESDRAHFMTRRFDRDVNSKHHIQSLCALSHLDYKQRETHAYEQYFLAISELELGDNASMQAFRRMAFNVMARNCDDHTKNFAFLLKQGGQWELAPAFDVTHAHNPNGEWTRRHLMSVNGKFDEISRSDLLTVADRFNIARPEKILNEVKAVAQNWPTYAEEAGVHSNEIDRVEKDLRLV